MRIDTDTSAPRLELDPRARLRHYVGAFRRRWYLLLVPLLIGSALGWFTAPSTEKPGTKAKTATTTIPRASFYRATHVLTRAAATTNVNGSSNQPEVNLPQIAYLVNTGEVPARTAERLGLPVAQVEAQLLGLPRDQVSSIEVTAVGEDPQQITAVADTAALELVALLQARADADRAAQSESIVTQLDDLSRQLSELTAQIAANPLNSSQLEAEQRSLSNQYSMVYEQFTNLANSPPPSAGLTTLQTARAKPISQATYRDTLQTIQNGPEYVTGTTTPTTTISPEEAEAAAKATKASKPAGAPTRAAVGGLTGLALGVGMILLLDRFDARLRRREDVETASGLTVIAEIPRMKRKAQHSTDLQTLAHPRSRAAEAYRVVRGAAIYALSHMQPSSYANGSANPAAVLMVTSADPGEGKTVTVANLAEVFAEGGLDVLVINCDFRRPRVHKYLLEHADAPATPSDVTLPRPTKIPRVSLVTGFGEGSSETNPLEVVAEQQKVIDAQRGNFDVILLDTAPFLASELLPRTDLVLVVVRSGKTTAESAHRTAEVLQRFSAPVLGVVFNASDESRGAQYYYYGYGEAPDDQRSAGPSAPTGGPVPPSPGTPAPVPPASGSPAPVPPAPVPPAPPTSPEPVSLN